MKLSKFSILILLIAGFSYCSKNSSSDSSNPAPFNLSIIATVSTDSSGNVTFKSTATDAVSFDYDFGNGVVQTVPSGTVVYKYPVSGTYNVNVVAKSAAGLTVSKTIQVAVALPLSLVWSDEFSNAGSPDAAKWGYDIGTGGNGWGNNELEYYTARTNNALVSNGTLKITAVKENFNGSSYTSARLLSNNKFSFTYGKIEVRAKLPAGAGAWPAIWMLGSNFTTSPWPSCGEIDIMEQRGSQPEKIYSTLHYPGHSGANGDGNTTTVSNTTSEFHRYAAEWTSASIKFMVDDALFYTFNNGSSLPFNKNFFIILNLAVGGNFGGAVDPSFKSAAMEVDYVRVYQ
ncbi:MAG: family 16 glycosylhydrolase [Bacteroidota bacterium]|nr:family 16 glycosylhydrolase [Bacteroidota bacterium]